MPPKEGGVLLTQLTEADSKELYGWINDREQVLLSSPYRPVHETAHDAWFDAIRKRNDLVIFGIRTAQNEQVIGSAQLLNIQPVHRNAELQIRLGETEARGQGQGTDAVRQLVRFGFTDLNLRRIYLHVLATNEVAHRVYEKNGFSNEGLLREGAYIGGRYLDVRIMGLLRAEWAKLPEYAP